MSNIAGLVLLAYVLGFAHPGLLMAVLFIWGIGTGLKWAWEDAKKPKKAAAKTSAK